MNLPVLDRRIDPEIRDRAQRRLARIAGQIRGLQRMIDEDRYCVDILTQISSAHEALRGVGRLMMQNYLHRCASQGLEQGGERAQEVREEILDLMYKYAK